MASLYCVSVFTALLLLFNVSSGNLAENCKKIPTSFIPSELCITTLGTDPRSQNADLPLLCLISANLTIASGNYIRSYIKKLVADDNHRDIWYTRYMKSCREAYESLEHGDAIIRNIESGDFHTAGEISSGLTTLHDDCEEGFNAIPPTLKKLVDDFNNLSLLLNGITFTTGCELGQPDCPWHWARSI